MANPNNPSNQDENQSNGNTVWDELRREVEFHGERPSETEMAERAPRGTSETSGAVFLISTKDFRKRMARQLAEHYLNERAEENVDTTMEDRDIEATSDKKDARKKKVSRFFKKEKGVIQNTTESVIARNYSSDRAIRAILGEVETEDPRLDELRKRLDQLTEEYVSEARSRYERAAAEDEEHFDSEGRYSGALAAEGELRVDERRSERANSVIEEVIATRHDFVDEEGNVDETKIAEYISSKFDEDSEVAERCIEKTIALIRHETAFDRAKHGMTVYRAELVGGTSRDIRHSREIMERLRQRSLYVIPMEVIAAAAGSAIALTGNSPESFAAGATLVAAAHGTKVAGEVGRDARTRTEARTNGLDYIGSTSTLEDITGNGDPASVINGLTVNNEQMSVDEARNSGNNEVQKIRRYEEQIGRIGSYETADAVTMTSAIQSAISGGDIRQIIAAVAEAESRLRFVHEKGKGVISYSSIGDRPKEERELREAIFEARKVIDSNDEQIQDIYKEVTSAYDDYIGDDVRAKDRMRRAKEIVEALRGGVRAGLVAVLGFAASQELLAAFDDKTMGYFERILGKSPNGATRQTIVDRLLAGQMYYTANSGSPITYTKKVEGLTSDQADAYRKMGWKVQQTSPGSYSAAGYIIDGKPANIVFGDNNTPQVSENLELSARLVDGKLSMPLSGTATSSMDGGKTVLDWGESIAKGELGVVKILPDGTGEFIPGATIDREAGRVLLGDGGITRDDFDKYRYCVTSLQDGKYTIFASEGTGRFIKQQAEQGPTYSAILERIRQPVTEIAAKLSMTGLLFSPLSRKTLGKPIATKRPTRSSPDIPNPVQKILDKIPAPPPTPPEPEFIERIEAIDISPTPPTPVPPIEAESLVAEPTPPPVPVPPSATRPRGAEPEPPITSFQPETEPREPEPAPQNGQPGFGSPSSTPVSPGSTTGQQTPSGIPVPGENPESTSGGGIIEGAAERSKDDRFVFLESDLDTPEALEELGEKFQRYTGEVPQEKGGGVLESEHYIMELVGPISSGQNEHGNIETDFLGTPNIMYKIRYKGEQ